MICTIAGEKIAALLHYPGSNDQQRNAADQCQSPHKGRQWNGLLGVDRGLERAQIDHLFAGRVGDALVGERYDAEHDECDAENHCYFHDYVLSRGVTQPASSARRNPWATELGRRTRAQRVVTSRSARWPADPTGQGQDGYNQEDKSQSPAGEISPVGAVWPGGQDANEQ
jgi:hypothetical protein